MIFYPEMHTELPEGISYSSIQVSEKLNNGRSCSPNKQIISCSLGSVLSIGDFVSTILTFTVTSVESSLDFVARVGSGALIKGLQNITVSTNEIVQVKADVKILG